MPNTFAYLALFSWPLVVFVLFRVMPRTQALIASILGGYLLLPYGVAIDPPLLPTLDKTLMPALSAAIMCFFAPERPSGYRRTIRSAQTTTEKIDMARAATDHRRSQGGAHYRQRQSVKIGVPIRKRFHFSKIEKFLFVLVFLTPFLTVLQNQEPYFAGPTLLPGLRPYDGFSLALSAFVGILPYLLGRIFLSGPGQQLLLLQGLCVAGLIYSLPALFEVRMSPQLSRWIYGFLAQPFNQAVRDEGFRPVVFLQHGLWLAIFLAMAIIAAFSLWRYQRGGGRWLFAGFWLLATLVLCRSFGGLAITLLMIPVVLLFPARIQLLVSAGVALIILLYPILRGADLVPVNSAIAIARAVSENRAESLAFRLKNEDILLEHANEKPLAGWGGYGRSRVHDQYSGRDISTTDGMWIIIVGNSGWLGYVAKFGLITAPILLIAIGRRRHQVSFATSGLGLILAANMLDMIPNATLTPISWLIAGALMGGWMSTSPSQPDISSRSSNRIV